MHQCIHGPHNYLRGSLSGFGVFLRAQSGQAGQAGEIANHRDIGSFHRITIFLAFWPIPFRREAAQVPTMYAVRDLFYRFSGLNPFGHLR
jgi:hypothetical protein